MRHDELVRPAALADRNALAALVADALAALDAGLMRRANRGPWDTNRWRSETPAMVTIATTAVKLIVFGRQGADGWRPRIRLTVSCREYGWEKGIGIDALKSTLAGWSALLGGDAAGETANEAMERWRTVAVAAAASLGGDWEELRFRPALPHVAPTLEVVRADGSSRIIPSASDAAADSMSPALEAALSQPGDLLWRIPASSTSRHPWFQPYCGVLRADEVDVMQMLRAAAAFPDCFVLTSEEAAEHNPGPIR